MITELKKLELCVSGIDLEIDTGRKRYSTKMQIIPKSGDIVLMPPKVHDTLNWTYHRVIRVEHCFDDEIPIRLHVKYCTWWGDFFFKWFGWL